MNRVQPCMDTKLDTTTAPSNYISSIYQASHEKCHFLHNNYRPTHNSTQTAPTTEILHKQSVVERIKVLRDLCLSVSEFALHSYINLLDILMA